MPVAMLTKALTRTGLNLGSEGSKGTKTWDNAKSNMRAIARQIDHLPNEVFDRILIPIFITFFDT